MQSGPNVYGFLKIGVVDAVPAAGTKPGTGTAFDAYDAKLGNVLEITAVQTSGGTSATLTPLRWFPPPQDGVVSGINAAGEWRRWAEDRPINLDSGGASVSGRYELPDESREYFLLLLDSPSASTASADAQSVYYRGRK